MRLEAVNSKKIPKKASIITKRSGALVDIKMLKAGSFIKIGENYYKAREK